MKTRILVLATLTVALVATPLYAGHGHGHKRYRADEDVIITRARVVDVKPIIEVVEIPTERRECWTEEVEHRGGRSSGAGMVVGSIIGGVLGNHVSRGDGVATVAGTVIGGAIGNDIERNNAATRTRSERHCRVAHDYYEEERVSGYRVTFRFHGETFTRRMDHDPGKFVRLKLRVGAAFD